MASTVLPAIFAICASLGVAKSDCTEYKLVGPAEALTDKTLWYSGIASQPNDLTGTPSSCYEAVAVATYDIYDGGKGTTYACKEKPVDDIISADEIKALTVYAARLNSINPKTLADHQTAMQVKWLVKNISGVPPR